MIERRQEITHAIKDGEVVHVVRDHLVIKDEVFDGSRRVVVGADGSWKEVGGKN